MRPAPAITLVVPASELSEGFWEEIVSLGGDPCHVAAVLIQLNLDLTEFEIAAKMVCARQRLDAEAAIPPPARSFVRSNWRRIQRLG